MPGLVTETPERPTEMIVNGEDITALSDDEIFRRLKELGADVGPIIASTRTVYERKLYRMLHGEPAMDTPNTTMNGLRFSDNGTEEVQSIRQRSATAARPEPEQNESIVFETPVHAVKQVSTPIQAVKQVSTPIQAVKQVSTPVSSQSSESPYVVSSRRPLHPGGRRSVDSESFNSSYRSFREANPNGVQYSSVSAVNGGTVEVSAKKRSKFATLFEVVFAMFFIVVGYIFYQEISTYSAAEQEYIDSTA